MFQTLSSSKVHTPMLLSSARVLQQESESISMPSFISLEAQVLTKINEIVSSLHQLEENFQKASQGLFTKNNIEGRENSKISAVQGKVITSRRKQYKNLEEEVDLLSKSFQDQFTKITNDLTHLQVLAKSQTNSSARPSTDASTNRMNTISRGCLPKIPAIPTFSRSATLHSSVPVKEKLQVPISYRVASDMSQSCKIGNPVRSPSDTKQTRSSTPKTTTPPREEAEERVQANTSSLPDVNEVLNNCLTDSSFDDEESSEDRSENKLGHGSSFTDSHQMSSENKLCGLFWRKNNSVEDYRDCKF